MACAAAKPIVNGLKEQFPEELRVINIDVQSALGHELVREYGSFTPTFIFYDGQGKELWRSVGTVDANKVRQSLQ
ncbi:MAG TPA: thioredoxin family protein [Anaerolineales bacterium]|nr:thioredoxin family protein [Anaerolineales bacterium]